MGFVKHHGEGSFLERGDYLGAVSLCFFVGNYSLQQGDAHPAAAEDTDPGQQRADEGHHFLRVPRRALGAELLTPAPTDFTTALRTKINIVAGES